MFIYLKSVQLYNRYIAQPESKTLTLPNPHLVAIHEANPSLVGCDEVPVGPSFAQSPTPAAWWVGKNLSTAGH